MKKAHLPSPGLWEMVKARSLPSGLLDQESLLGGRRWLSNFPGLLSILSLLSVVLRAKPFAPESTSFATPDLSMGAGVEGGECGGRQKSEGRE